MFALCVSSCVSASLFVISFEMIPVAIRMSKALSVLSSKPSLHSEAAYLSIYDMLLNYNLSCQFLTEHRKLHTKLSPTV